jgi:hypothetical protein
VILCIDVMDIVHEQVQWRALDEINSGVCDGMTYLEIKETMPEDYLYVLLFSNRLAF